MCLGMILQLVEWYCLRREFSWSKCELVSSVRRSGVVLRDPLLLKPGFGESCYSSAMSIVENLV